MTRAVNPTATLWLASFVLTLSGARSVPLAQEVIRLEQCPSVINAPGQGHVLRMGLPCPSEKPPGNTWRLRIQNPYVRDATRRSLDKAAEWLSFPKCQQVLSDFTKPNGEHLTVTLTALGVTSSEYLRLILFEDGIERGACRREGILAVTSPGSRVVHVCGEDFMRAAQRTPAEAAAVIIHETLHSLGLGENPPSSREITYRVRRRCWR